MCGVLGYMTSRTIRQIIAGFDSGKIFRLEDLGLSSIQQNAAVVALGRMVQNGTIERLSPGIYYKPKQTPFGIIGPDLSERFSDLLYEGDTPIGYLTGLYAFNLLGLTTQQSTVMEIGTNFPSRSRQRGIYTIRFVLQKNQITRDNIELLRLLDCIKWIKKVPDAPIDQSYLRLQEKVNSYNEDTQGVLVELAMRYSPLTRSLLGSMLEKKELAQALFQTLNPLTRFRTGISSELVSDKWNIE